MLSNQRLSAMTTKARLRQILSYVRPPYSVPTSLRWLPLASSSGPASCSLLIKHYSTSFHTSATLSSSRVRKAQLGPDIVLNEDFALPVNADLYAPLPEELEFLKATTGIEDEEALKAHVLMVQQQAYKVAPYPCIYTYCFVKTPATMQSVYQDILKIGRECENAVLLDVGSGMGPDCRKFALDGFPAKNIVATDLVEEFLDLGHVLFKTTKETFPANFVAGDVFNPAFLSIAQPARGAVRTPRPDLTTLTSLNPLHGHCSVINATGFFHLFNKEQQVHLARAVAGLLSPEPGSLICGLDFAAKEKGLVEFDIDGIKKYRLLSHSPESWMKLWYENVFSERGEVKVQANYTEVEVLGKPIPCLLWYVRRL